MVPCGGASPPVRRETYLTGQSDLESYARYFTNAEPQNDMERAAQKLKEVCLWPDGVDPATATGPRIPNALRCHPSRPLAA